MRATLDSIDDVVKGLDAIIDQCRDQRSRLGYFPALYRKVTIRVRSGIAAGEFEDGPRMEKLDIVFASRYLEAWEQYQRGDMPSRAWLAAFQAGEDSSLLVLQHLMLGMNAHINLDLGIAAARVCPGTALPPLQRDFNRINTVLAGLVDGVKSELETVWKPLRGLDVLAGKMDDVIVNFSMSRARNAAWHLATCLAPLTHVSQLPKIAEADMVASVLAQGIIRPPMMEAALMLIRGEERGDVRSTIDLLM